MIKDAQKYINAGISIIPTDTKTKQPYFSKLPTDPNTNKASWKIFQAELPTNEQVQSWFDSPNVGLAIVLGPVSDNMELLDFDNHLHNAKTIFTDFRKSVKSHSEELYSKLVIQSTQSGGFHVIYRCEEIEGNQKLATQADNLGNKKCVIETRGEGGYALAYPTAGYELKKNSIDKVQLITSDERDFLLNLCRSFNTAGVEEHRVPYTAPRNGKARPGDDYNEKADVYTLLNQHGWVKVSDDGKKQMYRRPGKSQGGASATFNFNDIDKLYVFSSNAHPFEAGKSYDKFAIYTLLEHGGDFAAAAKQLLKEGYGEFEPRFRGYGNANSETEVDANGQIVSKELSNAVTKNEKVKAYLDENYDVRKNLVTQKLEVKRKDEAEFHIMEDADLNQMWLEIDGHVVKNFSTDKVAKMLNLRDYLQEYHPFKDYFESLPKWDGSDHISDVINMVTPAKGQDDIFKTYFFKWIVAVVASAIEEKENHTCLVFSGDQGIGKTTFFRNLVPPELQGYYKEEQIDPNKNDDKVKITNSFLINLDELDGVTKKENQALKHFMSSSAHDLRMPYAHFSTLLKRRASFCGSVNDPKFLGDATGSRRFFIIDAEKIDYTAPINHSQMYAQALNLLNHDFQYWLDMSEIEIVNKENERYEKANPAKDLMDKYFEVIATKELSNEDIRKKLSNYREFVFFSNTDILDYFKKRHPHIDVWQNALGLELKKRGGERKSMKVDGTTIHGYLLKLLKVDKEASGF